MYSVRQACISRHYPICKYAGTLGILYLRYSMFGIIWKIKVWTPYSIFHNSLLWYDMLNIQPLWSGQIFPPYYHSLCYTTDLFFYLTEISAVEWNEGNIYQNCEHPSGICIWPMHMKKMGEFWNTINICQEGSLSCWHHRCICNCLRRTVTCWYHLFIAWKNNISLYIYACFHVLDASPSWIPNTIGCLFSSWRPWVSSNRESAVLLQQKLAERWDISDWEQCLLHSY